MAGSDANTMEPHYQPYQCLVCQSRFTRHENLKRHSALHTRSSDEACLPCDICKVTFSRRDLRHRHMKRKHPEHEEAQLTKRLQRRRAGPKQGSEAGTYHEDKTPSLSPGESQYGSDNQLSGGQEEPETDGGMWQTVLRYGNGSLVHDHRIPVDEDTCQSTSTSMSVEADNRYIGMGKRTQLPSMNQSSYIGSTMQDEIDVERSLLLEASLPRSIDYHVGTQIHSTSTSLPASLGAYAASNNFGHQSPNGWISDYLPRIHEEWFPSTSQTARGFHLFFTHVSHFVPFLHQPTFDATQIPRHLILSILCLAYHHGEDPDCGDQEGSGTSLAVRCFHRARLLVTPGEERVCDVTQNLAKVQAYLLLQICAMMYLCGEDSAHGLAMHTKMISLARSGGLMQPISSESTTTQDLESLWRDYVKTESLKRTVFAVHQIDALWYQFLSIPRSLSHLEIKHDLPCPSDCWTAPSAAQWAYRQLISKHSGPSVGYADAVRLFLSPDPDLSSLPAFDPYGAINIAHFLISSAREISGWSAMTGRLSMERFEPLRLSLVALGTFIHPQKQTVDTTHGALCEATWEMAMIEMQMWSPSHTGGIVEASMDGVLNKSTYLTPSCDFLLESNTADTIQPHIDWFLHYLDTTLSPDFEPPWVALYAYKAFLIAWQLVRGGLSGAMQIVRVDDGDVQGAIIWARKVFQRRQRRQLGKLIMTCLELLET